jgi:hypothetical protein
VGVDLGKGDAMHILVIVLLMSIFSILSIFVGLYIFHNRAGMIVLIEKWFVFWAASIRLFTTRLRQALNPRYAVEKIGRIPGNRPILKQIQRVHWGICIYLLDRPLTMEQIKVCYGNAPFHLSQRSGSYAKGGRKNRGQDRLYDDLAGLLKAGWVKQEGDQFALTGHGRQQVNQALERAKSTSAMFSRRLRSLFQPEVASKVTLLIQIILALIKLPAGLLSGSVGLLNDSADTILDLLSSVLVYFGIRFDKERLVSILLVVFMLGTGAFTLYEAIKHILTPSLPEVDWFCFAAAILSALAGLILWTYQRYVGILNGSMTFIAESVDARNHVIVALSVTAGLVASLLHFGLLDMLVGLVVAILILWSAIQLVIDLVCSSADDKVDLSRYGFWLLNVYKYFRDKFLKLWMLQLINQRKVQARANLVERVRRDFDFRNNPWMKVVGLDRQFVYETEIEQDLNELFACGLVFNEESPVVSQAGKKYLKWHQKHRRVRKVLTLASD